MRGTLSLHLSRAQYPINCWKDRKPSAFCKWFWHFTLSIKPIILNIKLLTCFHKVFWIMPICRGPVTLRQKWLVPSSLSRTPGTLHDLPTCKCLWQCLFSPVMYRFGIAEELGGGGDREVILKFKILDDIAS